MKQLRKVSALLIALALVLTMVPMSGLIAFAEEAVDATVTTDAPAESETTAPVEEVSEETAEAAALLQSLNVLKGDESGNLNLTGDVTRAEFATFVVRMIGQEEVALASAGKQIFDDVAADHWGNGYIDVAYNAKIIQGYGDGNFGPDAPVTYEQAIKMIVCALGYGDSANEKGGWPSGYLRVANEMKITKGVKVSGGQPAKRGDIVSMIYNSLEIDVMRANKAIKDGIEGVSYTVVKGDNVLTYFLGLEKAEGIVTANAFTRIDSTAAVDDDVIVLSYVDEFEVGAIDADGFLGQSVSIYYELDAKKGKKNIVFIKPQAENI
ncbi:MAG: S-layer homology domain-containing protein, partial [Clostridia bacterium]|nr:S-layer homology domain-containing protein [Clostridia bacterium]